MACKASYLVNGHLFATFSRQPNTLKSNDGSSTVQRRNRVVRTLTTRQVSRRENSNFLFLTEQLSAD